MRAIAVLCLCLMFAAPELSRRDLSRDDVARFVAAAEEAATVGPGGIEGAARRQGLDPEDWEILSRRIWTAFEAKRMETATGIHPARIKLAEDGLAAPERRELLTIVQAAQHDVAALMAATEADRTAIAPFYDRLARLSSQ